MLIDEISMMSSELLDNLSNVVSKVRTNADDKDSSTLVMNQTTTTTTKHQHLVGYN